MGKTVLRLVVFASVVASLGAVGCKNQCDKLYDHVVTLSEKAGAPAETLDELKKEDGKTKSMELCRRESPSAVKCALVADSLDKFLNCKPKPVEN